MDVVAVQQAKAAVKKNRANKAALLQPVASRGNTYYSGTATNASNGGTYRTRHMALCNITSLSLVYGNFYGTSSGSQGDGPNAITVKCSVELGGAAAATGKPMTRGYRNGVRAITLDPGAVVTTDPIPVNIPKGTAFYIRTFVSVSAGGSWPVGISTNASVTGVDTVGDGNVTDNGEGQNISTGTDLTAAGSASVTSSNALAYSPLALLGTSSDGYLPAVGLFGDSIMNGSGDFSDLGFMVRALNNTTPYLKLCQPGEFTAQFALNGYAETLREGRFRLLPYLTHGVSDYGVNDVTSSRTFTQLRSDLITTWSTVGQTSPYGIKLYQTTITPGLVNTTDNYATTANQTPNANDAVRTQVNDWLRDGAPMHLVGSTWTFDTVGTTGPTIARCAYYGTTGALVTAASGPTHPLVGVFEMADIIESARNSGKIRADLVRVVTDAAMNSSTSTLTSATAVFTSADVGKGVRVAGAGAAGAVLSGRILKVNSATSVTINATASTTVSGQTVPIGIASTDGTHPTAQVHTLMAAAIPTALFVV